MKSLVKWPEYSWIWQKELFLGNIPDGKKGVGSDTKSYSSWQAHPGD